MRDFELCEGVGDVAAGRCGQRCGRMRFVKDPVKYLVKASSALTTFLTLMLDCWLFDCS